MQSNIKLSRGFATQDMQEILYTYEISFETLLFHILLNGYAYHSPGFASWPCFAQSSGFLRPMRSSVQVGRQ